MIVGIFGAWRPEPGDPIYVRAEQYGKALALAGHAVLTGAYSGVMEAANRGALEAGGRSIGVTCPEIDSLLAPNEWLSERIAEPDLPARLARCFRMIDAAVFFPGRSGTITELSLALEMREKGLLTRPVYLACDYWGDFLQAHLKANEALPYPSSPAPGLVFVRCDDAKALISRLEVDV